MRVGLALSGGAARGMALLGVLDVLVRSGIPIDLVAGCSAGSVLGALWCSGFSLPQMYSLAPYLNWRRLISPAKSENGLFRLDKFERWLTMVIGELEFADLAIPLSVVAIDVNTGERVVVHEGQVARAVRASCSVPAFIEPVEIDGRWLADGGIIDNLPSDAAREMGADFVIGVDVFKPHYGRKSGLLGRGLTTLEILVRNAGGGAGRANFLIRPATAGQSFVRFSHQAELIHLGQAAAEACLPELQTALTSASQKKTT